MKLGELLGRADLKEKFVLQKLLCLYLSCSREELWTSIDKELSDEFIQKVLVAYKAYVEDKKPLEYVLGHVDFFGKEFLVNEATLIPRPETEYMITAVTEFIHQMQDTRSKMQVSDSHHVSGIMHHESNVLLDIGTGCGVLGISVLLQNPGYFAEAIFTDYFADALEVAKQNYECRMQNAELKVQFLQSDLLNFLFQPPFNSELGTLNSEFILVANLPYIPEEAFEQNSGDNVKKREPKPAFVGGEDGLDYYRIMLKQIISMTHEAGSGKQGTGSREQGEIHHEPETCNLKPVTMFLEMMTWQVDILRQEFGDHFVFEEVKTFHFNIRIVKAYLK